MKQFVEQVTLDEMQAEIKREIAMRERVYPRWIDMGRIAEYDAKLQILKMKAVLAFLDNEAKKNTAQGDLFE